MGTKQEPKLQVNRLGVLPPMVLMEEAGKLEVVVVVAAIILPKTIIEV